MDLLREELPEWDASERETFRETTGIEADERMITAAGNAFVNAACTDCTATDWDSPEGEQLAKDLFLLGALREHIAYDPVDILVEHSRGLNCPPFPALALGEQATVGPLDPEERLTFILPGPDILHITRAQACALGLVYQGIKCGPG